MFVNRKSVGIWLVFVVTFGFFLAVEMLHALDAKKTDDYLIQEVTSEYVDELNEGKTILIHGILDSQEILTDGITGVSTGSVKMSRTVSMYQWDDQSYQGEWDGRNYRPVWSTSLLDSFLYRSKKYTNPKSRVYQDALFESSDIRIWAFQLDLKYVGSMQPTHRMEITRSDSEHFRVHDHQLYSGSISDPQIGDVRISYDDVPSRDYTVLGRQEGARIVPIYDGHFRMLPWKQEVSDFFPKVDRIAKAWVWLVRTLSAGVFLYAFVSIRFKIGDFLSAMFPKFRIPEWLLALIFALWTWVIVLSLSWVYTDISIGWVGIGLCLFVTILVCIFYRVDPEHVW